jgi:hypothetical protein
MGGERLGQGIHDAKKSAYLQFGMRESHAFRQHIRNDQNAFYTTRYWPSIDSELALASARGQTTVRADRIQALYGLFKPVSRLSFLRTEIQSYLASQNQRGLVEAFTRAKKHIEELDDTVIRSGFLQDSYAFAPGLTDQDPYFTPEEEAFGRSASFVSV